MDLTSSSSPFDLIGIGVGPFNLGLACLLEPVPSASAKFFETKDRFDWHPGLLMEDCLLQVPFLADLVSMVDPCSRFSYLNYLHQQGRLYRFYFYENFHTPRADYNRYCRWASEQLSSIEFSSTVVDVALQGSLFCVSVKNSVTGQVSTHLAKNLVLGVGTTPHWPAAARSFQNNGDCLHSADYLFAKRRLQSRKSITVVGGGQSAAEVFLDLLDDQSAHGYKLQWVSRSSGFFPMEYSKLGLEHFSPDYIDYFHSFPQQHRDAMRAKQGNWYKGISFSTIKDIYDRLYKRSMESSPDAVLQARSELKDMERVSDGLRLRFRHLDQDKIFEVSSDAVVLATGYQYAFPACLENLRDAIRMDPGGRPEIRRDYSMVTDEMTGRIFVQNGEIHSHGIGAQDLGLGPYRSATIVNSLLGREHYALSTRNVFQSFGIADTFIPHHELSR
ncbi:hypothetical protein A3K87_13885 [Variovorax paradoxus]|uniref:Uncharacterized protein n=1 Tax=Variovorax paradoxus TaxID=34073 RepID=A0AA91DP37_VARPD|nr:SidA/IucD/PvdA family monooxygenase [Variovorax paradoxus]OAK64486.1 hypothetical protein A3K87_13885 [Variovorax paradoxus]